eukprot:CAMPEP_0168372728 /NCGR_PEP_ID=MMETSP0228-20121227/8427_1 /TAXON_ID=133427 /ORGANISM="Protoceratium reticulatum, Strain CCCM 535 (=CCMP 1889)" /LENGTH=100 /DNA_ID=CAMNT_0008385637 /DNA_START=66 /DNA_END=368 /DNA_ORIENTATION=-
MASSMAAKLDCLTAKQQRKTDVACQALEQHKSIIGSPWRGGPWCQNSCSGGSPSGESASAASERRPPKAAASWRAATPAAAPTTPGPPSRSAALAASRET